jgi:hypothetical protein
VNRNIYGDVNSATDIHKISLEIRREMDGASKRSELTELKKRSDYLCALAAAPSWAEKFDRKIATIMRTAEEEDAKTTRKANRVAKHHGWSPDHDAWGGD